MIKTIIYHKVADIDKWKKAFDDFHSFRKSNGELSYSVGIVHEKPNTVCVINEWESADKFQSFADSKEMKEAMESAGVVEEPTVLVMEEMDKG